MELSMPNVETKRLYLRPIEEADASDVFAYYRLPETMRYLTLQPHATLDFTLYQIRTYFLAYQQRNVPQTWAIIWKEKEIVIGNIDIHTIEDGIGEIGYVLHPDYWHKGIMKEALQELVRVGFMHTGLRRIEAKYALEHLASAKVLEACGFQKEGVLRQFAKLSDGYYHDMVVCAILKEDWMKGVHNI